MFGKLLENSQKKMICCFVGENLGFLVGMFALSLFFSLWNYTMM